MYTLYGDGIHDDTAAIQELIDGSACELTLPCPQKYYLISAPLELPSNFKLILPRFAEIRLAPHSNCLMLKNKLQKDPAISVKEGSGSWKARFFAAYANADPSRNIEITGGIWNCNNMEQNPNPFQSKDHSVPEFWGYGMYFYKVIGFKMSSLTIKDPTNFGATFGEVSYFTMEDITFDYNLGNPATINMDGLHFDGNCHFGTIRNLKGACYDDLVALNAHEGTFGHITNIEIDGIFAEDCHSAVRLLTAEETVENIHISNVYGTYYQYCIGLTNYYYLADKKGLYRNITLDHIYASKAIRNPHYPWPKSYVFPLIWMDKMLRICNLKIRSLHRNEKNIPVPTICVRPQTEIDRLILEDISTQTETEQPVPLLLCEGHIHHTILRDVFCESGEIFVGKENIDKTEIK